MIILSDTEQRGTRLQPIARFYSYVMDVKQRDISETIDFFDVPYGTKVFLSYHITNTQDEMPAHQCLEKKNRCRKNPSKSTTAGSSRTGPGRPGPDRGGSTRISIIWPKRIIFCYISHIKKISIFWDIALFEIPYITVTKCSRLQARSSSLRVTCNPHI